MRTVPAHVRVWIFASYLTLRCSGNMLVFNNDLTNIESCWSPFHPGIATSGPPFTLEMLNASVAETANRGNAND